MRTSVIAFLGALLLASPLRAEEVKLVDPKPSWENPRRIMLQLTSDSDKQIGNLLSNAVNLQKFYGQDKVKVAIIAYAAGVRSLMDKESPAKDRILSLMHYDVEFIACGNTLDAMGRSEKDLIVGVKVVQTGIAEIAERSLSGWIYVAP